MDKYDYRNDNAQTRVCTIECGDKLHISAGRDVYRSLAAPWERAYTKSLQNPVRRSFGLGPPVDFGYSPRG